MDDLPALPILEAPSRPNSPSLTHIYDLPEELIVEEILSRLDSVDLARIRCVSNTPFYDFPTEFRSINLLCNLDRYTNAGRLITPFKIFATDLILTKGGVNSISISVEERANHKSIDIKLDDLYLTEVSFVYRWLRRVRRRLTSLSISDYPMHSRRKWSEVLSLISFHCTNLHELVLKNAWLSTKGMSSAMFKLTSLTLACVRLDDEDLDKVNSCCPSLRILKLILVEGLKEPRIDLLHLRTCQYVGSSFETTARLQLIHAPNLTRIKVGFGQRIAIIRWGLALGSVDLSGPLDVTSALTYRTYKTKLIMPLTFYLEKQLSFSRDKKICGKTLVSMYDQLVEIFFRRRYFPDFLLPKRWRTSSTDIKLLTKPYLKRKPTSSSSPTPSPTP